MKPLESLSLGRAWLLLCSSLAAHVADEALTGFLAVYNPTVVALRAKLRWWPVPTFGFTEWLSGLIVVVVALLSISIFVFHNARWVRPLAYVFAIIMLGNGLAHVAGTIAGRTVASVQFSRPMPGFYTSPLLVASSLWLLVQLHRTARTRLRCAPAGVHRGALL